MAIAHNAAPFLDASPSTPPWAIEKYIHETQPSYLRPLRFFPAWQGVITLAFSGFPTSFKKLKQEINENLESIPKENPGSLWPKVTLGALKDSMRLTPEMLKVVSRVCSEASGAFDADPASTSQALLVDSLDIVFYCCRSLERQICRHTIQMLSGGGNKDGEQRIIDEATPSTEERYRIQAIVDEVHSPDYWFFASKDGNRETHYRGNAQGVSLVHHLRMSQRLQQQQQAEVRNSKGTNASEQASPAEEHPLFPIIRHLRDRIDAEVPGMYAWMNDDSLHCTFRALM